MTRTRVRVEFDVYVDHDTPHALTEAVSELKSDPGPQSMWSSLGYRYRRIERSIQVSEKPKPGRRQP